MKLLNAKRKEQIGKITETSKKIAVSTYKGLEKASEMVEEKPNRPVKRDKMENSIM